MSDTTIDFELDPEQLEELRNRLEQSRRTINDLRAPFQKIGQFMVGFFSTFPFVTQGAIYGEPWEPLSSPYDQRKAKTYRGRNILVASGEMQQSFDHDVGPGDLRVYNYSAQYPFHQTGTEKMPQRLVMSIEDRQERFISDTLVAAIDEALGG